jgi:HEPN domain-containing protein
MALDPKRSTAHGFWAFSAQYFLAAEAVRGAPGRELSMPIRQLYGQSIELALKAFLLKRGLPLVDVRALSHRLKDILTSARQRRLGNEVKLSVHDVALIVLLNDSYSTHRFRYIESGSSRLPEIPALASVAEKVVGGLEEYCTGKAWGLRRGRG